MILACPKMPGISLNITNVRVLKSLRHTLPDFKNPESAIWWQAFRLLEVFNPGYIAPLKACSGRSPPPPYLSWLRADLSSSTSLVSFRTSTSGSLKLVSTQVGIFDPLSISFVIISFTLGSAFAIDLRKALVRKRTAKKMTLIVLKNDSRCCVNSKADRALVF